MGVSDLALIGHNLISMITLLLHLLRLFPFLCGGLRHLALGNLALRHQVAVYKRTVGRLRMRTADRLLLIGLTWIWVERDIAATPAWRKAETISCSPGMTWARSKEHRGLDAWLRFAAKVGASREYGGHDA